MLLYRRILRITSKEHIVSNEVLREMRTERDSFNFEEHHEKIGLDEFNTQRA